MVNAGYITKRQSFFCLLLYVPCWRIVFPFSLPHICFCLRASCPLTPLVCLPSDRSVSVSDISCSGGPGLLPHLRQVLPGLQCGAGICGLDLIRCPRHTQDSREPQQTSQSPQTGQGIHLYPTLIPSTKTSLWSSNVSLSYIFDIASMRVCRFRVVPWRGCVCVWQWWSLCSCLFKEARSPTIFTACCLSLYGTLSLKSE